MFASFLQQTLQEKVDPRDGQVSDARVKAGQLPNSPDSRKSYTACLRNLVSVALEIAGVDEMLARAEVAVPAGMEARRWHQVSIQAMKWKREALAEQQSMILSELRALMRDTCAAPPEASVAKSAAVYACSELQANAHAAPQDFVLSELRAKTRGACAISQELTSAQGAALYSFSEPEAERSPEVKTREPEAPPSPAMSTTEEPAAEGSLKTQPSVVGSLRNDLQRLREYEVGRCLLVRGIKRLGFESAQKLRGHFQRYGAVTEVFVAHSFEKPSTKRRSGRFRAAAIGFVVMDTEAAACTILRASESHLVEDGAEMHEVLVQAYDQHVAEAGS